MGFPTFASKRLKINFGDLQLIGLDPDNAITMMRNSDLTDEEISFDGFLSTSVLPDGTGTATIRVLQQAVFTNKALAKIVADQEASGSLYKANLVVRDPSGSVICDMGSAYLKKTPEMEYGSSATGKSREWVFYVERFRINPSPVGDSDNPVVEALNTGVNAAVTSFKATALDVVNDILN